MGKPEDVSEAAWDAAVIHVGTSLNTDEERELVARAIMAAERRGEEREREACAVKARDWLKEWAGELAATWEGYIEAKTSGRHYGRRIKQEDADLYAKQFRERAEAVDDCAEHVATAIRSRTSLAAIKSDGEGSV